MLRCIGYIFYRVGRVILVFNISKEWKKNYVVWMFSRIVFEIVCILFLFVYM